MVDGSTTGSLSVSIDAMVDVQDYVRIVEGTERELGVACKGKRAKCKLLVCAVLDPNPQSLCTGGERWTERVAQRAARRMRMPI